MYHELRKRGTSENHPPRVGPAVGPIDSPKVTLTKYFPLGATMQPDELRRFFPNAELRAFRSQNFMIFD
jgi:hypothetical protein